MVAAAAQRVAKELKDAARKEVPARIGRQRVLGRMRERNVSHKAEV